jgi:hypothetical protein
LCPAVVLDEQEAVLAELALVGGGAIGCATVDE